MPASGFSVGRVYVSIVPDAARFASDLAAKVTPAADTVGKKIGSTLQNTIAKAIAAGINEGLIGGGTAAKAAGGRAGEAYGGEFDRIVRSRIDAALRTIPPVTLNVATSEAEQKLRDIRLDLESLSAQRIGVDISDEAAIEKVRELRLRLLDLSESSANIQIKTDTGAAIAKLDEVLLKVDELGARSPSIHVDADTAEAEAKLASLDFAAASAGGGFGTLITAGLALGPALIPVIAAVTAAVAGLIATLGSIGIAGGVLALGFSGVKGAMQALTQEQTKQAAASAAGGAAAGRSAGAQTNAAAQIKQAEESLANTRANAAESARRAAQAVVTAKQDEVRAEREAADKIASAEQRLVDARDAYHAAVTSGAAGIAQANDTLAKAERDLADAQRHAADAQVALTEARKTAQQQLEDLANSVADNALAVRQADLDVKSAQDNLTNTNASPLATADQKAQAQLAYDEAIQRVKELALQTGRLADQKAEADKAGIEGSQQVISAQQAIVDANQQVADSQQAVTDATKAAAAAQVAAVKSVADAQRNIGQAAHDLAEAQVDSAQSVTRAQQAVTNAIHAQADQQRQSAFAIEQALASVAAAHRAAGAAAVGGGGAAGGAFDALKAKIAAIDPYTLAFAKFLLSLRPELNKLREAAAKGLLPGVEAGIKTLLPFMPQLIEFVGKVAGALGNLFLEGSRALTSPMWRQFFGYVGSSVVPIFDTFARILGNVALGFGGLIRAFAPTTTSIGGALLELSRRFARFGDDAGSGKSSGFNGFLAYIKANAPLVIQTFRDIGRVIGNLTLGLAGTGPAILIVVDSIAKFLANLDPSTLANIYKAIVGVSLGLKAFGIVAPIIRGITAAIGFLIPVIGALWEVVLANPIVAVVVAIIAGLVLLYTRWGAFRDIVNAVWHAVATTVVDAWQNYILPTLKAIADWLVNVLAPALVDFWQNDVAPTWDAISAVIVAAWHDVIQPTLKAIGDFLANTLAPAISGFYNGVVAPVFAAIGTVIKTVWLDVVAPILNDFYLFIKDVLAPIITFLFNAIVKPYFEAVGRTIRAVWVDVISPTLHALWSFIRDVVAPVFKWLYENAVKPALDSIGSVISSLWHNIVKPAFSAIGSIIAAAWRDVIKPALDAVHKGLDGIGNAFRDFKSTAQSVWYDVQSFFASGVNGVIDIINTLTHAISSIPGVPIHISAISHVSGPARAAGTNPVHGFARGGVLPGYAPGVDSIRALLSPGEGILVPEAVLGIGGAPMVHYLNHLFSGGRAGQPNAGPNYGIGGVVGGITKGVVSVVGSGIGIVGDAVGAVEHAAVGAAEAAAHAIANAELPAGLFRTMANAFINLIGGALKFDEGGWLMPGMMGVNLTQSPEPVFNADQWSTLKGAAGNLGSLTPGAAQRPGHTYTQHFHNNGQPITPGAVVAAQNRNAVMHDLPQLVGLG